MTVQNNRITRRDFLNRVVQISAAAPLISRVNSAVSYQWHPVAIGAGGWVTGFVSHPLDASVRYCRTDVGNAYRWDNSLNRWAPMIVCSSDRKGIAAVIVRAPGGTGIDSIAMDPSNKRVVLVAFPINHSQDIAATTPSIGTSVYRSEDGGLTFTKSSFSLPGDPNGKRRYFGERLKIDPHNSRIVYFGTPKSGLFRSKDGGHNWSLVLNSGVPMGGNIINVQISPGEGTVNVEGQATSRIIYFAVGDGDVFRSEDGGQNWENITKDTGLSGHAAQSTLDQHGTLYVSGNDTNMYWRYSRGAWTPSGHLDLWDGVQNVAVDPMNANRIFVLGRGGNMLRSIDGGATWTVIARQFVFSNKLGWLPQAVPGWRSNSGVFFDRDGELWVAQGNEGILRCMLSKDNSENESNPIKWKIDSAGIEELCTQDVIIPKGGGKKAYVAVNDATGMVISDPASFTAEWIGLETKSLIAHGCGVAACPNDPQYVAIAVSDAHGYTNDGGKTWKCFAEKYPPELFTGSIAVSRRGGWNEGADHMVILPANNRPPYFSKDGGKTWRPGSGFPIGSNGAFQGGQDGYWGYFLKQRQLRADPFTPDRYYLKLTSLGFWVSIDGGENWRRVSNTLPVTHHGQLDVNYTLRNDLWLCDGWEGAYAGAFTDPHGVFHSINGGVTWKRLKEMDYVITLALGVGVHGVSYSVYVYGKRAGDERWGVFRSIDGGATWARISYYPAGIFDQPTCMAASWDTFGLVYIGFGGQSYVYGKPG